ncbi:hypothetical protein IGI04_008202 [Brassica rapa subsp. trilocularis]|uniref:Myb-like domain-containing protein n=1 Tax=Brassica rapa subsp. trilocularis TaxID=1813537 RepID=A0ABQ7NM89_BRACM|nr:hypothetical protein IGI04_008202 [Brassica rapa subsp. trilocularis]
MLDWGADQVHQLTHDHDPYQKQQQQLQGFRKGPWTPEEDKLLTEYVTSNGEGKWSSVAKCAVTINKDKLGEGDDWWVNYLRPGLKRGQITPQEEGIILELHFLWGNNYVNFIYGVVHFMGMHLHITFTIYIYIGGLQLQDIYQDEQIMKSRTIGEPITRRKINLFRNKTNLKDPGNN